MVSGITSGLVLVTGATGSGKTALVVSWLMQEGERPIYCQGVPDLALEHRLSPPIAEWTEMRAAVEDPSLFLPYFVFPPGSVLVVDEAQRVFPPRPTGSKVPPIVGALSTRRHTGLDIVLITQHPQLLDAAVRKLVTHHYHIHQTGYGDFLLYWVGCGEPGDTASRKLAERTRYKPDKKTFTLYKSADAHTRKRRRIPRAAVVGGLVLVLAGVGMYLSYQALTGGREVAPVVVKDTVVAVRPVGPGDSGASARGGQRSGEGYVKERLPEVVGLAHTAPAYAELTRPVAVPYPAGCIQSSRQCRCFDQRGGDYQTDEGLCRQWVRSAFFVDWVPDVPIRVAERGDSRVEDVARPQVVVLDAGSSVGEHRRSPGAVARPPSGGLANGRGQLASR